MSQKMLSILQIYNIETNERTVIETFDSHIEAPNWSADGAFLYYNSAGAIYRFDLATKQSEKIDTGVCVRCNNDHVLSPDGKSIAVSSGTEDVAQSRIWIIPLTGGEARLITPNMPSYLHGWSPDGTTLAYCAARDGEYDVYTINVQGGAETRLTDAPGLDDGPEYSPDGNKIWFNSVRSGLMQAFCMNQDGTEQTQMTFDEDLNSWFPHISPDNQKVVFVAYHKGDVAPGDHPANKNVVVRLMNSDGSGLHTLFDAFGGQGTMNVNSWAPDSKRFAFVTYQFV